MEIIKKSLFKLCLIFAIQFAILSDTISQKYYYTIEYDMYYNAKFGSKEKEIRNLNSYLEIENKNSHFYSTVVENYKSKKDDNFQIYDTIFQVWKNFEDNFCVFKNTAYTNKVQYYSDSLHPMSWNLSDDFKKIDSLICYKASCNFRGRQYEVWYCPEISLDCGPWKLGGLPGLIVEAREINDDLIFRMKSFKKKEIKQEKYNFRFTKISSLPHVTNYFGFMKKVEKLMQEQLSAQQTDCLDCETNSKIRIKTWEML
jgi:GLPGLI family protein